MEIAAWLQGLGLERYEQMFRDNDLDAEVLPELTEADLEKLGISLGHRKRLLKAIAALQCLGSARADVANPGASWPSTSEGERRQVTVLFADLAGFTRLSTELDAEQVRIILDRFFETVDAIVVGHGGSVDKHIGDCVMAVFGAPVAHSDDPERALRAALAIRDAMPGLRAALGRELDVHVGVACGEVVAGGTGSAAYREYTVTGETVNLAARLADKAQTGEILVSEALFRAVAERVCASAAGEVELDGFTHPIRVWRVSSAGVGAQPVQPRPFVGRRAEFTQLEGLLEACLAGKHGQLVHIRGEAGIGKTRLVEELLLRARGKGVATHKALVLDFGTGKGQDAVRALVGDLLGLAIGAAVPERQAAAALALAENLVDARDAVHLNDLLDLPQPTELVAVYDAMDNAARQVGKRRTASELVRRLSRQSPRLIVIEDVHWADAATLDHLRSLAGAVGECRALLVLTSRTEGDPLNPTWRASTPDVPLATIDLRPLRKDEARILATTVGDVTIRFAEACVERAGGNPFFLEQLLRTAEDAGNAVPGTIQSVVLARMDMLASRDRHALQTASVLGQRFDLAELQGLLGDDQYDCSELVRRFLLRPEDAGFLFVHALIRDGAYASLLQAHRREFHRRAAAWFAGRDSTLHATHLDHAGDPAAPAAYLAAAEEQVRAYRHERARQLVERGLRLATSSQDRFALACRQGDILRELGVSSEAMDAYAQALDAAELIADKCRARVGLAGCMRMLDRYDEAFHLLDLAETDAADAELDFEQARIHHLRGNLHFPLSQIGRCQTEHARALDHARRAGSIELEARALGGLADADYMSGRMRTAHERFSRCVALAREQGFGRIEVANLPMVGHCLIYASDFERGWEAGRQALELASRVGHLRAEIITHNLFAQLANSQNRLDVSDASTERLVWLARQIGSKRFEAHALHLRAEAARLRGAREDALALLEEALAMARESGLHFVGPSILAQLAATTHDAGQRAEALAECEALLAQGSIGHNPLWSYRHAIEASLEAGDWAQSERYAQALEDYARAEPLIWSEFWTAWGRTLAAHGRSVSGPELRAELTRVRDQAVRIGMAVALPRLDRALVIL